jgi:hypothetical protein
MDTGDNKNRWGSTSETIVGVPCGIELYTSSRVLLQILAACVGHNSQIHGIFMPNVWPSSFVQELEALQSKFLQFFQLIFNVWCRWKYEILDGILVHVWITNGRHCFYYCSLVVTVNWWLRNSAIWQSLFQLSALGFRVITLYCRRQNNWCQSLSPKSKTLLGKRLMEADFCFVFIRL